MMSEKQFKVLSGGFDEDGNPLYLIKDTTEMLGNYEICKKVIEQQATISNLKEENEQLRQMIKENVFGGYVEGSLADLEFKAIAYDDIIKLEISNESEPKLIVVCKRGKKENVKSFCQMFIPFGIAYEIVEMIDDE